MSATEGSYMTPSEYLTEQSLTTDQLVKLKQGGIKKTKIVEFLNLADYSVHRESDVDIDEPLFKPSLDQITFQNYEPFKSYEVAFKMRNQDKVGRRIKTIPPQSPYFNIVGPLFTSGKSTTGKVAPGMEVDFRVKFTPDDIRDYTCELTCVTEREKFIIPIRALGARGRLDLPDKVVFDECLVKHRGETALHVRNVGDREVRFVLSTMAPFSITPADGVLGVGMSRQLNVAFCAERAGTYQGFMIVEYDTGEQLQVKLIGTATDANVSLARNILRLDPTYITLESRASTRLVNRSNTLVHFAWKRYSSAQEDKQVRMQTQVELAKDEGQARKEVGNKGDVSDRDTSIELALIARKYKQRRREVEADLMLFNDDVMDISPVEGDLWPNSSVEVTVTFRPQQSVNHSIVAYCDVTGREARMPLRIKAQGLGPRAVFAYDTLDLGNVFVDSVHNYELFVANRGEITARWQLEEGALQRQLELQADEESGAADSSRRGRGSGTADRFVFTPTEGVLEVGEQQPIRVTFSRCGDCDTLGKFEQRFEVDVAGASDKLTVDFKGAVIGPTFNFDCHDVEFGVVPFGFVSTRTCTLQNTSEIPLKFSLHVPQEDSSFASREFEVTPAHGVVEPFGKQEVTVDFIPASVRRYDVQLVVGLDNVGDHQMALPMTAQCVVPRITLQEDQIDFGQCSIRHEYEHTISFINESDCPAKYELLEQGEGSFDQAEYDLSPKHGTVPANTDHSVKVKLTSKVLGHVNIPLYVRILGSEQAPLLVTLMAVCTGPSITVDPEKNLDFGRSPVLQDDVRTIIVKNTSDIPAPFKALIKTRRPLFRVEPAEGTIPPEDSIQLKIIAALDDTTRFKDDVVITVAEGETKSIAINAMGVGTTVSCKDQNLADLQHIEFGTKFAGTHCSKEFTLENNGRRTVQLKWFCEREEKHKKEDREKDSDNKKKKDSSNPKQLDLANLISKTARPSTFRVTPATATLDPHTHIKFKIDGVHSGGSLVARDKLMCVAMVGSKGGKSFKGAAPAAMMSSRGKVTVITEIHISARFIIPLLAFSTKEIRFEYVHSDPAALAASPFGRLGTIGEDGEFIEGDDIEEGGVEQEAMEIMKTPSQAFKSRNGAESPDEDEDDAAQLAAAGAKSVVTVSKKLPMTRLVECRNVSKLPVEVVLATEAPFAIDQESMTLQPQERVPLKVSFNPVYREDRVSETVSNCIQVTYPSHPQEDSIALVGDICFPNVSLSASHVEFGAVPNDTETQSTITLTNPTRSIVSFTWSLLDDPDEFRVMNMSASSPRTSPGFAADGTMTAAHGGEAPAPMLKVHPADLLAHSGSGSDLYARPDSSGSGTYPRSIPVPAQAVWEACTEMPPSQVFDMTPMRGMLKPGESCPINFTFFGHPDRKFKGRAACEVAGGPEYLVRLYGEASPLQYNLDRVSLEFGMVPYESVGEGELVVQNTGRVAFDVSLSTRLISRPGVVEVAPSTATLDAMSKKAFKVWVHPGAPVLVSETLVLQIAHFPPVEIPITAAGTYNRLHCSLPRVRDDSFMRYMAEAKQLLQIPGTEVTAAMADTTTDGVRPAVQDDDFVTRVHGVVSAWHPMVVSAANVPGIGTPRGGVSLISSHTDQKARAAREAMNMPPLLGPHGTPLSSIPRKPTAVMMEGQADILLICDRISQLEDAAAMQEELEQQSDGEVLDSDGEVHAAPIPQDGARVRPVSRGRPSKATLVRQMQTASAKGGRRGRRPASSGIAKSDRRAGAGGTQIITLRDSSDRSNKIVCARFVCDFGNVVKGTLKRKTFRVTNTSYSGVSFEFDTRRLVGTGFSVDPNKTQKFSGIPHCESGEFNVNLQTRSSHTSAGLLESGFTIKVRAGPAMEVILKANIAVPNIRILPDNLEFGRLLVSHCRVAYLQLLNTEEVPCEWEIGSAQRVPRNLLQGDEGLSTTQSRNGGDGSVHSPRREPVVPTAETGVSFDSKEMTRDPLGSTMAQKTGADDRPPTALGPAMGLGGPGGFPAFAVQPTSGFVEPGERINIAVRFAPPDQRSYAARFPLKVSMNPAVQYLTMKGVGASMSLRLDMKPALGIEGMKLMQSRRLTLSTPRGRQLAKARRESRGFGVTKDAYEGKIDVGAVLPYSTPIERTIAVVNPTDYPVEFFSVDFDKQYLKDEEVLAQSAAYVGDTMLIPPRRPGESLYAPLVAMHAAREEQRELARHRELELQKARRHTATQRTQSPPASPTPMPASPMRPASRSKMDQSPRAGRVSRASSRASLGSGRRSQADLRGADVEVAHAPTPVQFEDQVQVMTVDAPIDAPPVDPMDQVLELAHLEGPPAMDMLLGPGAPKFVASTSAMRPPRSQSASRISSRSMSFKDDEEKAPVHLPTSLPYITPPVSHPPPPPPDPRAVSVIIHGPPCSGRTTLATRLAERYTASRLSLDSVLRHAVALCLAAELEAENTGLLDVLPSPSVFPGLREGSPIPGQSLNPYRPTTPGSDAPMGSDQILTGLNSANGLMLGRRLTALLRAAANVATAQYAKDKAAGVKLTWKPFLKHISTFLKDAQHHLESMQQADPSGATAEAIETQLAKPVSERDLIPVPVPADVDLDADVQGTLDEAPISGDTDADGEGVSPASVADPRADKAGRVPKDETSAKVDDTPAKGRKKREKGKKGHKNSAVTTPRGGEAGGQSHRRESARDAHRGRQSTAEDKGDIENVEQTPQVTPEEEALAEVNIPGLLLPAGVIPVPSPAIPPEELAVSDPYGLAEQQLRDRLVARAVAVASEENDRLDAIKLPPSAQSSMDTWTLALKAVALSILKESVTSHESCTCGVVVDGLDSTLFPNPEDVADLWANALISDGGRHRRKIDLVVVAADEDSCRVRSVALNKAKIEKEMADHKAEQERLIAAYRAMTEEEYDGLSDFEREKYDSGLRGYLAEQKAAKLAKRAQEEAERAAQQAALDAENEQSGGEDAEQDPRDERRSKKKEKDGEIRKTGKSASGRHTPDPDKKQKGEIRRKDKGDRKEKKGEKTDDDRDGDRTRRREKRKGKASERPKASSRPEKGDREAAAGGTSQISNRDRAVQEADAEAQEAAAAEEARENLITMAISGEFNDGQNRLSLLLRSPRERFIDLQFEWQLARYFQSFVGVLKVITGHGNRLQHMLANQVMAVKRPGGQLDNPVEPIVQKLVNLYVSSKPMADQVSAEATSEGGDEAATGPAADEQVANAPAPVVSGEAGVGDAVLGEAAAIPPPQEGAPKLEVELGAPITVVKLENAPLDDMATALFSELPDPLMLQEAITASEMPVNLPHPVTMEIVRRPRRRPKRAPMTHVFIKSIEDDSIRLYHEDKSERERKAKEAAEAAARKLAEQEAIERGEAPVEAADGDKRDDAARPGPAAKRSKEDEKRAKRDAKKKEREAKKKGGRRPSQKEGKEAAAKEVDKTGDRDKDKEHVEEKEPAEGSPGKGQSPTTSPRTEAKSGLKIELPENLTPSHPFVYGLLNDSGGPMDALQNPSAQPVPGQALAPLSVNDYSAFGYAQLPIVENRTRWVVPPRGRTLLVVCFSANKIGSYERTLTFEMAGTPLFSQRRDLTLHCRGLCAFPRIVRDPSRVFALLFAEKEKEREIKEREKEKEKERKEALARRVREKERDRELKAALKRGDAPRGMSSKKADFEDLADDASSHHPTPDGSEHSSVAPSALVPGPSEENLEDGVQAVLAAEVEEKEKEKEKAEDTTTDKAKRQGKTRGARGKAKSKGSVKKSTSVHDVKTVDEAVEEKEEEAKVVVDVEETKALSAKHSKDKSSKSKGHKEKSDVLHRHIGTDSAQERHGPSPGLYMAISQRGSWIPQQNKHEFGALLVTRSRPSVAAPDPIPANVPDAADEQAVVLPPEADPEIMKIVTLHKENNELLTIINNGAFPVFASLGFRNDTSRDHPFSVYPKELHLEKGESKNVAVTCYPQTVGEHEDCLIVGVRDNPSPLSFTFNCVGTKPEIEVSKKSLVFERLLLTRKEVQTLEIKNNSLLPVAWYIPDYEMGDEFSISLKEGRIDPGASTEISVQFHAIKAASFKRAFHIEATDAFNITPGGVAQTETVAILAEAYEVAVEIQFPKSQDGEMLDFHVLRVGEESRQMFTMKNRGKYNTQLKFTVGPELKHLVDISPSEAVLSAADKALVVNVTVVAREEVVVRNSMDLVCKVTEVSDSGVRRKDELAVIPIKFSVRAVFAKYRILPARGLNFGPLLAGSKKTRSFQLRNDGEFEFRYHIVRYDETAVMLGLQQGGASAVDLRPGAPAGKGRKARDHKKRGEVRKSGPGPLGEDAPGSPTSARHRRDSVAPAETQTGGPPAAAAARRDGGSLSLGPFTITPSQAVIAPGSNLQINVEYCAQGATRGTENENPASQSTATTTGNKAWLETVVVDVADRNPTDALLTYELAGEACVPGLNTWEFNSIFEEQAVCARLDAGGVRHDQLQRNVYAVEDRAFSFGAITAGTRATERFKLMNPNKVACDAVICIRARGSKGVGDGRETPQPGGKAARKAREGGEGDGGKRVRSETEADGASASLVPFYEVDQKRVHIPMYEHRYISVTFCPTAMQVYPAIFEASVEGGTDARTKTLSFELRGEGTLPHVVVESPKELTKEGSHAVHFGRMLVGRRARARVAVRNDGIVPVVLRWHLLGGKYAITSGDGATVDKGDEKGPRKDHRGGQDKSQSSITVPAGSIPPGFVFSAKDREVTTLSPQQRQTFEVTFSPSEMMRCSGEIKFSVERNAFEDTSFSLMGEGYQEDVTFEGLASAAGELITDKGQQMPQGDNVVIFDDCTVQSVQQRSFELCNRCNSVVRFGWNTSSDKDHGLVFIPSIGHIPPQSSKEITLMFAPTQPRQHRGHGVLCNVQKIQYKAKDKGGDDQSAAVQAHNWDDRRRIVRYEVEGQRRSGEEAIGSSEPVTAATTTKGKKAGDKKSRERAAKAEKEERERVEREARERAEQLLAEGGAKTVPVEVPEPEPHYEAVKGSDRKLELQVSGLADFAKYNCATDPLVFADCLMFQSRVHTFPLANASNTRMEYAFRIVFLPSGASDPFTEGIEEIVGDPDAPFSVAPASGTISSGDSQDITVRFAPTEVDTYERWLIAHIPNLHDSLEPLCIHLQGRSLRPLCHFELPDSDYISSGRRNPERRGPAGKLGALDAATRVIEIHSCGIRVKNTKRFFVLNPTSFAYEFEWMSDDVQDDLATPIPDTTRASGKPAAAELDTQTFACRTPKGIILPGKKFEMVFDFVPDSLDLRESFWRFRVPEHSNVQLPFVVVGTASEPDVTLSQSHVNFRALLVGRKTVQTVQLVNSEVVPFAFSVDKQSFDSDLLSISPLRGTIPPNGVAEMKVTFSPLEERDFNVNVVINVRNKPTSLSLNVKGIGYALHCTVMLEALSEDSDVSGKRAVTPVDRPSSSGGRNIMTGATELHAGTHNVNAVHFGAVQINQRRVRKLIIVNSGRLQFDYSLVFPKGAPKSTLISVAPEKGEAKANDRAVVELSYRPLQERPLTDRRVVLKIANGPVFALSLQGQGRKPQLAFSYSEHNFGACFLHREGVQPPQRALVVSNEDTREMSFETKFKNPDWLQVGATTTVLSPGEQTVIDVTFFPREAMVYEAEIPFEINGSYTIPVHIRGEGALPRIELASPDMKHVAFGAIRTDQKHSKTVRLVNRSKLPARVLLTSKDLAKRGVLFKPCDKTFTLKPKETKPIDIEIHSSERIAPFAGRINMYVKEAGIDRPIIECTGAVHGMDVKLESKTLVFGPVVLNSKAVRRVQIQNSGDLPCKFRWDASRFKPDFRIRPAEGFLHPGTDMALEITFCPTELNEDIRYDRMPCRTEVGTLFLTLTGSCVAQQAEGDAVQFKCPVRETAKKSIAVRNDSTSSFRARPVISHPDFSGAEFIEIRPGQSRPFEITYSPLTMTTEANPHSGSIFFPLPDGGGQLHNLMGIAGPPTCAGRITCEGPAKIPAVQRLKVENWLNKPQRFKVQIDMEKPDATTSIRGLPSIDVPALAMREHELTFLAQKEGMIAAKITFLNPTSNEYSYYEVTFKALPPGVQQRLQLESPVRTSITRELRVPNPLDQVVLCHASCTSQDVSFPATLPLRASSETVIPLRYLPLQVTPKPQEVKLSLKTAELGDFNYVLDLSATPAAPEKSLTFTVALGGQQTHTFRFMSYARQKTEFMSKVDGDFEVEKMVHAPASPQGQELTTEVVFEPSRLGDQRAMLTVKSPQGGEYVCPLFGHCVQPRPQGPLVVRSGGTVGVPFKNVFPQNTEFTFTVDNPMFTLTKHNETITSKKTSKIEVVYRKSADASVDGKRGAKSAGLLSDRDRAGDDGRGLIGAASVTGKLMITAPSQSDLQWIYYLKGI